MIWPQCRKLKLGIAKSIIKTRTIHAFNNQGEGDKLVGW